MNPNDKSHDPLVERALVGFDLAAEHHLANCGPCQTERERVEDALRQFGAANREYANRSESFWEQQAAKIRAARSERTGRSGLALTLTPGLAVLLLLAFALLGPGPVSRPAPAAAVRAQPDSDHALLVEVERAIQSETPLSLGPAALMIEADDSGPMNSTNSSKEPGSHEN
jgi:hypothetical protein